MRRLIFAFLWVLLLCTPARADGLTNLLPEAVGDLPRIELLTGPEAQAEVDRLHGKPLEAVASGIARYAQGEDRPAEVWVSQVASEHEARRQAGLMVHKMFENPQSPFKQPTRIDHRGLAVYRFTGMGQAHLIWSSGDLVWWVSCAPEHEQAFLEALAP